MKKKITKLLVITGIVILVIIQIYPVIWLFMASLKPVTELNTAPFSLPQKLTLTNYVKVTGDGKIGMYMINSLKVTAISIILIVFLSSTAAFSLSKFAFKISKKIYAFFSLGIMIPVQITLIPLFIFYSRLNILNTSFSIILPQVGFALPLTVMIFLNFYIFIPNELIEAAIIDGCSSYRIFFQIIFPLSSNTVITVSSIYFILIWNDFIFANTFISETTAKTVAIGLRDYVGAFGNVDWGSTFAAIAISILPPMIIYFALNNKVTAGMTQGATKG
ncbi:MAG: carbohydrate ABC transporter permease [Treponema sp.]|jgi:raffinose/stachyose/melibiose transport system permease protein|nr:carbohydrate ABC transporter permease [Treponema sp.]